MSNNIEIIKDIIKICTESIETDVLSEEIKCECGKVIPTKRMELWQPIDRSNTYMIRNTLQSMLDIGGIVNEAKQAQRPHTRAKRGHTAPQDG